MRGFEGLRGFEFDLGSYVKAVFFVSSRFAYLHDLFYTRFFGGKINIFRTLFFDMFIIFYSRAAFEIYIDTITAGHRLPDTFPYPDIAFGVFDLVTEISFGPVGVGAHHPEVEPILKQPHHDRPPQHPGPADNQYFRRSRFHSNDRKIYHDRNI